MVAHHFFNGHTIWFDTYENVWCIKPGYSDHCTHAIGTFPTCDAAHEAAAAHLRAICSL